MKSSVKKSPFLLSFDEINGFVRTSIDGSDTLDEFITSIEGFLAGTYKDAVRVLNEELDEQWGVDYLLMNEIINEKIEGKDFRDRIKDHDSVEKIINLVESEYVRVTNRTRHELTKDHEFYKRWNTMQDDRVRDTHDYLEGHRRPVNRKFYTYDGDAALYPHGFSKAENNVNCRCWCSYEKGQGRPKSQEK